MKILASIKFSSNSLVNGVYDIEKIDFQNGIFLKCGKKDPQLLLGLPHPIRKPYGIAFCKITFINTVSGILQVFWDYGEGLCCAHAELAVLERSL